MIPGRASSEGSTLDHLGMRLPMAAGSSSSGCRMHSLSFSEREEGCSAEVGDDLESAVTSPNSEETMAAWRVLPFIESGQPTLTQCTPLASRSSQRAGRKRSAGVAGRSVLVARSPVSAVRIPCWSGQVPVIVETSIAARISAKGKWRSATSPESHHASSTGRAPSSRARRKAGPVNPSSAMNSVFILFSPSLATAWPKGSPSSPATAGDQASTPASRHG